MSFVASLHFSRRTRIAIAVAVAASVASGLLRLALGDSTIVFAACAVALAGLAMTVGEGTDQLGHRLGAGATGVLQSALGNLPELFIGFFALRAGLVNVVQAALVGSILANSLFVLGLAFVAGGLRHGTQSFGSEQTRMMSVLLVLAVAGLAIPFLATAPGEPDAGHQTELSVIVSIVLLVIFAISIPFSVRGGPGAHAAPREENGETAWPLLVTIGVVAAAALAAAFVSDWFVSSLRPAMAALGMSEAFAGLVVVAIAGNAVENVVGIQMAMRNQLDLAISVILNGSLQIALALTPILVLLSIALGGTALTLVLSPLLIGALVLTALLTVVIVVDGKSTWLEGAALVGLYVIIAASVWWGPAISG